MDSDAIMGVFMIYTIVHGAVLQFGGPAYVNRTSYEKVVTIFGGMSIALIVIGLLMN